MTRTADRGTVRPAGSDGDDRSLDGVVSERWLTTDKARGSAAPAAVALRLRASRLVLCVTPLAGSSLRVPCRVAEPSRRKKVAVRIDGRIGAIRPAAASPKVSTKKKCTTGSRLGLVPEATGATGATAALATGCARLPVQALLRHRRNGPAPQGTLDQNRRATKPPPHAGRQEKMYRLVHNVRYMKGIASRDRIGYHI